jgi:hypothetical protein
MSDPAGLTLDEALERIEAGWHVKPGFLELLERDYDSAQRKRYLRTEHERIVSLLRTRAGASVGLQPRDGAVTVGGGTGTLRAAA